MEENRTIRPPVHPHHAEKVGIHDPAEFLRRRLLAGAQHQHRRALDHRVHPGLPLQRPVAEALHALFIRHVQGQMKDAVLLPLLREASGAGDDPPSGVPQRLGGIFSQPAGGARNPCRFSPRHFSLPFFPAEAAISFSLSFRVIRLIRASRLMAIRAVGISSQYTSRTGRRLRVYFAPRPALCA